MRIAEEEPSEGLDRGASVSIALPRLDSMSAVVSLAMKQTLPQERENARIERLRAEIHKRSVLLSSPFGTYSRSLNF